MKDVGMIGLDLANNVFQAEGSADRVKQLSAGTRDAGAGGPFVDGRRTAGWHAKLVKNNRRLEPRPIARQAGEVVQAALLRNDVFRAGVLPHSVRPPMFARAGVGEGYGPHDDDALMAERPHLRSDASVTVFLSAPEGYDGGELVIDTTGGEQSFKLSAGSAVIYPSTSLHRVEPITSGERDVAVT